MKNHWIQLTQRYRDERQCLASFIAWQAAEVIAMAKPANLINVLDRDLPCNRNIFDLWSKHGSRLFAMSDIRALELRQRDGRLLVLIYHPETLDGVLQQHIVKKTLAGLGYQYADLADALAHLKTRMSEHGFPHEIGFFLGYPLKDVLAFMGLVDLPLAANGPWKIYGKLEKSLTLVDTHNRAREQILKGLDSDLSPLRLLQKKRPAFQQAA
jgi:hypothetical protein